MLKNYLRVALRNLLKNKIYSFINITGLAVGMACCILILFFVRDELSYDNFHQKAERMYRATMEATYGGQHFEIAVTPSIVAPMLQREFPEVENTVRLYNATKFGPVVVRAGDKQLQEKRFYYADSTLFNIFTFPMIYGDPQTALVRPNTIVLTQSTARKYFGDENPLGRSININNTWDFEITGVMQDIPHNAHLQFDLAASYTTLRQNWAVNETWESANLFTYFLLKENQSIAMMEEKLPALIDRSLGEGFKAAGNSINVNFMPVQRIHLYSQLEGETNSDIVYVYIFSIIAILILLIACVNYMNLATARSARRAQEVGLRKVLGAFRKQLAGQFFGESALVTFLALVFAIVLVHLVLPFFNLLSGKQLVINYLEMPLLIPALLGFCILVSLIAGSYPALFLSAFQPIKVLKAGTSSRVRSSFRNKLVVFQFVVSIALIISTVVISNQLDFFRNKKLGFDKEQVLILNINDKALRQDYPALKKELLQHSGVVSVSATSGYPGNVLGGYTMSAQGLAEMDFPSVVGLTVDGDFVETAGIELIAGKGLPKTYNPEQGYFYLINEAALKRIGWQKDEAIGRWVNLHGGRRGELVGITKNFHFASLHSAIEPLAMFLSPKSYDYDYLLVKLNTSDIRHTVNLIEQTWEKMVFHRPFEYTFVDQEFEALYRSEDRLSQIFILFTGLAVLIACLGLLGLISFTAEQRTKEIGIRKVLGASVSSIVVLLSKDFLKLVFISIFIAVPIAYLAMQQWLQEFAYRIDIGISTLVFSGILALLIALLTVSYQSIKAALSNPAKSIRYE